MRHILSTALALSLAPFAAFAEENETIVVTATRAPTPLQRLPARVEVVDRADIEALNISSLAEAIGADAVQAGGAGQQASLFLRGANSKHALALLDGVRLNDASTPNAQYDFGLDTLGGLSRVEVLRGPASSIYGSDAVGGAVNMIPRRGADQVFAPYFEFAAGELETRRALIGAAGSTGNWDYGLGGELFDTEGHDLVPSRIATHDGDPDAATNSALTASVRYAAAGFGFDLLARTRENTTEFDTFSGGPFFDLRADDPDLENQGSQHVWRMGGDYALNDAVMLRVSAGQVLSDRTETDDGLETSRADSTRDFADAFVRFARGETVLTAGAAFERNDIDTVPQFADALSVSEEQSALYLIGQTAFGGHLDATASVRVDDYDAFGAHTTYALGLVGEFEPVRVYASYGTAFKAPSLSERYETSFFNIGNPDLAPEESQSWELGADVDVLSRFRVGGSFYQTRIDNLIEYDFAALQNINIAKAAIDGAEIYAEANPSAWSSLRLAHQWTDARNDITDAPLARRPESAWRLDARVTPIARWALALSWTYVGERTDVTYSDAGAFVAGAGIVPSYNVGAVSGSFDLNAQAELFARIDNVTDETYEQPAAFAGQPRTAQIGLRARF